MLYGAEQGRVACHCDYSRVENGMWAHEFGHVFSFGHAGTLHCPQNAVDCDAVSAGGDGVVVAYGDGTDTMGNSYATIIRGFSTPNAIRVGLLDSSQWVDVPADSTQQITIQSRDLLAGATAGTPLAVRVTDPVSGRTYYVEVSSRDTYNQGQWWGGRPADNSVRGDATYQFDFGVRILRFAAPEGASYQNTYLLPAPVNADGVRRGVWDAGTTFNAPDGGVSIEVVSFEGTTATLNVTTRSDVVAPAAPTELASDGQAVTGIAEPGSTVSVAAADGTVLGTTTADVASGAFTAQIAPAQLDGVTLEVTAEDAAGNVSDAAQVTVVVPVPTAPATPTGLASDGAVVTGTADPGVAVVVSTEDGDELGTATADATTGAFSVALTPTQADGARLSVIARNAAGTESVAASVTVVRPAGPAPTPPNGLASDGTTVTGTAEPGTSVTAYDATGTTLGSAVADAETGAFTITLAPVQADGSVLTLVAQNADGDASEGARTTFIACVVDDDHGTLLRTALSGIGVDVDGVRRVARPTGTALILVTPDGENSIVVSPGANHALDTASADAAGMRWADADILVLNLESPLDTVEHVVAAASTRGVRVLVNAAPAHPLRTERLAACDPLVVNEHEARILVADDGGRSFADLAGVLLARGARSVVITLGADGALIGDAAGIGTVPSHAVDVVDTTGAGDAFVGAMACQLARGASLREAVVFATAVAAMSVQSMGAHSSYPDRAEVERWLGAFA